jgi:biotin operon repressor
MNTKILSIEEIRSTLDRLRQDPNTQHRFPRELWDSIIQLTNTHSREEICQKLNISPMYLKRKIENLKDQTVEFREIPVQAPALPSDMITIELSAANGLKARIHGHSSCLSYLHKLFGG